MCRKRPPKRPPRGIKTPQYAPRTLFGAPAPSPGAPTTPPRGFPDFPDRPPAFQKLHSLLQKNRNTKNAKTPCKTHGFEHFQKASNELFGHQKWPQEAPWSPPRDPMTPPRRPQDVSHADQNVPLRLPHGPRRPETFQDAANTYGDIPNKRASRLLLLRFLAPHQKVSKNLGFYRVCGSSALQKSAKKEAAQKWAPRGLQDAFWAPKSGPKRRPRAPQEAPKTPQDALKRVPRGPLGAQNRPQEPPRRPQDAPRSSQIALQRPQSCIF